MRVIYKRQHILIFAILLLLGENSFGQAKDSVFADIKIKYKHIRDNLKSYDTTSTFLMDESTEGGEGTAYYEKGKLKFIDIIYFGETGKAGYEYYFDNEQLFFVLRTDFIYNRPFYYNEKYMKSNNDSVMFDSKKTKIMEDRYYFKKEKLIRWLGNDKKEVDFTKEENSKVVQELINHAHKIKDKLRK